VTARRPGHRPDEPRPLRDSLAEVSADLGLPEPDALAFLIEQWGSLVGPDVAPHCRLTSLRDGVLRVTVDTAPRGTQLRYLEGELVERAASLLGPGVVRELRVRVGAPSARRGD
jgi:predicted nucleic acid-binding Zn ribbon protein